MKKLLLLCTLFLPIIIQAQIPKTLDSLEIFLKTKPHDSTYAKAMKDCAFAYFNKSQYYKADSLANAVKILGEKINFPRGIYSCYVIKAAVANYKSESQKSLDYFLKAYEIAEKYLPKVTISKALSNLSVAYSKLGDKNNEMKYDLKSIEIQEKYLKSANLSVGPYQSIARILKASGQYEKALRYFEKAGEISKITNDTQGMAINENNLGTLYDSWGKQKEALFHFEKGLELAEKIDYKFLETDLLVNLGEISLFFKQETKAENYFKRCEKLCREFEATEGLRIVCTDLGGLYLEQKKYPLAEKYLIEALNAAKKVGNPQYIKDSNEDLAKFYAVMHNFSKAFQYSSTASVLKDSVFKIQTVEKTQELLTKYESEKKEAQIKLLQEQAKLAGLQNKATIGGSALLLLLSLISGAFIYNSNKLKQYEETQQLRNKISADLHDEIGSTLSSISLLSGMTEQHLQQNQPEKAGKMMQKIYTDSQQVMESMDDIIWTVNPRNDSLLKILIRLKEFAQPLVESQNITFEFNTNPDTENLALTMEIRRNLYLIVKEAINNLVKYSEATKASVSFEKDGKNLYVKIQDNGKGFDNQLVTSRNGLKNMEQRASDLGGKLSISSDSKKGTNIILTLSLV